MPDNIPTMIQLKRNTSFLNGKIYLLSDASKSWVYIGSTCRTLEERRSEHIGQPVNKDIKQVIDDDVKIELIQLAPCMTEIDLLWIEKTYIKQYHDMGYNVLNVKHNSKSSRSSETPNQNPCGIHFDYDQDDQRKFPIKDNQKKKLLRINWTDENGKAKSKEFKYGTCGHAVALEHAEAFRNELLKKFY